MINTAFGLAVVFLGFGGFFVAYFIYHKKKTKETMVCPLKAHCDTVIHSDYSKFLGMPVEILGMFYYGFISLCYGILMIFTQANNPLFTFLLFVLTLCAFLFSLYLTFVQAFAIKNWCTWCLISASISTAILLISVMGSTYGFVSILAGHYQLIVMVHVLMMALGLGSATVADILFWRFLRDFKISELESDVLKAISSLIWLILAGIIISGLGLYLPQAEYLNETPKFLAKMIIVAVIIINGAFLNILVAPKLVQISFGQPHEHEIGELRRIHKIAFALGSISIISWYSAFVLGSLRNFPYSMLEILFGYSTFILLGLIASQVIEKSFSRQRI